MIEKPLSATLHTLGIFHNGGKFKMADFRVEEVYVDKQFLWAKKGCSVLRQTSASPSDLVSLALFHQQQQLKNSLNNKSTKMKRVKRKLTDSALNR